MLTQDFPCCFRSYLGSTIHWIDNKTLIRKSCALSCVRIQGRHTFDVLAREISSTLTKYSIQTNTTHAVTDNAANFGKAFRICNEHNLTAFNNIINGIDDGDSLTGQEIDELLHTNDQFVVLPQHIKCMAHTFNLCSSTDLVKEIEKDQNIKKIHKQSTKKCQQLWNSQNTSIVKADFIKSKLQKLFKTPTVTRWNSFFDSLKDLLNIYDSNRTEFDNVVSYLKLNSFTSVELDYLKSLCLCSEPIAIALDIIQGEKDIYCGVAIPLVYKCIDKLEVLSKNSNLYIVYLSKALCVSVKKRFESVLNNSNMQCATILHPQFKYKALEKNQPQIINEIKNKLKTEYNTTNNIQVNDSLNSSSNSSSNPSFWDTDDEDDIDANESDFDQLIESIRSIEDYNLKKYKQLKTLFLRYNSAMPSSASVERLFSTAKRVLTPERMRLSDEHFEMQLLLHQNHEILN